MQTCYEQKKCRIYVCRVDASSTKIEDHGINNNCKMTLNWKNAETIQFFFNLGKWRQIVHGKMGYTAEESVLGKTIKERELGVTKYVNIMNI